jgi:hypothetical protein
MDHPSIDGIPLVLGSNIFGKHATEDESFAILDAFFEAGGRMIDTAQVYSETKSETILGKWTNSRGNRAGQTWPTGTCLHRCGTGEILRPAAYRLCRSLLCPPRRSRNAAG